MQKISPLPPHARTGRIPVFLLCATVLSAAAQERQPGVTLETVEVVREHSGEYRPQNTRSATRTDTPIREIPQSVSAIPKEVLEDAGEAGVFSALEFGGVGADNEYVGGVNFFTVRGFRSQAYARNGMMANVGSAPVPDAAGIESLDVLRGSSSLMFGASDPGGAFNMVSKQPQEDAAYAAGVTLDSHGGRRVSADLTGALNESASLLYRVNAAVSGGNTFRDHMRNHREYFAPRLGLRLAAQTRLLLDVEWTRGKVPLNRGIPLRPDLLYGPPPRTFFPGDPNVGRVRNQNTTTQLRLEHVFAGGWRMDAGLQRITGSLYGHSMQLGSMRADRRSFSRALSLRDARWSGKLAQIYVNGRHHLAGVEHQLLAGMEYSQTYSRNDNRTSRAQAYMDLDIYNPVYGLPMPFDQVAPPGTHPGTVSHNRAFVIQDQIRLTPALSILAALRHDRYHAHGMQVFENSVTTPRLGASYAFSDTASGYLSYSRSFKPNNSQDANGNTFDAERGRTRELGLKTDLLDKRLHVTTALFHTLKTNVLTQDPLDNDLYILAGAVRSQGVDISLAGKLGARTRVIGYFAWLDAAITKDNNPQMPPGTRLKDVPMRRVRLMALHDLGAAFGGMEVGATLVHVAARSSASNATGFQIPAYSTVDLLMNYPFNANTRLRFSLKNLFDRHYYARSFTGNGTPGEPRTGLLTLEYKM